MSLANEPYNVLAKSIPVAIYARVSSDMQAKGDSIPHQISHARDAILRLGKEYYNDESLIYIDEALSGYYTSLLQRPAIQRLINDAKEGRFKVIIFKEITRLGRDPEENMKIPNLLNSYGVRVLSVNDGYDSDNPDTKIVFSLQSVLAEKESDRLGSRVSVGYREKARSGKWSTVAPYGYTLDDNFKLQINEDKAEVVRTMYDMYVNKRIGTELIAKHLNEKGIPSPKGL
ncbi:MAG: recombinase family protein, partial [Bacillaceae bacterium]